MKITRLSPLTWLILALGLIALILFIATLPAAPIQAAPTASTILINEFIASPTDAESIELCNPTGTDIDVSGWTIDWGYNSTTINAGQVVPANGYLILDNNNTGGISISNDGTVLSIKDTSSTVVDSVGYGDDGGAPKPEYHYSTSRAPDCTDTNNDAADWNTDDSPTMGSANDAPIARLGEDYVTINEVSGESGSAFIELYNTGSTTVDLSGWRISVDDSYDIPSGQSIPGGGFWVLNESDFPHYFHLDANKDNVYLFNSHKQRVDQIGWSSSPGSGNSWNRLPDGSGSNDGWAEGQTPLTAQAPTKGYTNVTSGEQAPAVTSTDPTDGATDVAVDIDIIVRFSEDVNVSGNWFLIDCTKSGQRHVADTNVTGGPATFTIDPNTDFSTSESCHVIIYKDNVTDQDTDDPPDTMDEDYAWDFSTVGAPPPCSTIPLIQGTGYWSNCQGHRDNIEGCITGVTSRGFFFQDVNGDGDPNSSDGIYAYFYKGWTNPNGYHPGMMVKVSGNVTEYYDTTEFAHSNSDPLSVTILDSGTNCGGAGLPSPASITPISDPNADPMAHYEKYEGMRVQMSFNGFVVGPTKRFVSDHAAGDPEIAFVDQSSSIYGQRVFEDDYPGYQGINYISGGFDKDLPDVDFGDSISANNLVGVLGYQFDKYTLLVDGELSQNITVTDDNDSDDAESAAGENEFTLCTFNIENMFDTVDDGDGDMGDWVPASTTEYNVMLEKRAKAIVNSLSNCTVIGLEEVEGKDPVWQDLIDAIAAQGGVNYNYDYYESIDPRDITTGILYDPSRVTLNASYQKQGCTSTDYGVNYANADNTYGRVVANPCTSGTYPLFNRPPYLAQLTIKNAAGNRSVDVSVIVNHFKSKRGDESVNLPRREAQAQHVVSLMQDEYDAGRPNSITLGDFNDVLGSSTLAQFDANVGGEPLVNLYLTHVPEDDRYSYIFSGESEVLDHFIMTSGADDFFMEGRAVHINADFPDVPNLGNDNCSNCVFTSSVTTPTDNTIHRSSDHDPVLTRFSTCPILDAPTAMNIAINSGVSGVDLSWNAVTGSVLYKVWKGNEPYFTPDTNNDTPLATTTNTNYTDPNSLGDPTINYYYTVTAVNACGVSSQLAARMGEFDFALVPGASN